MIEWKKNRESSPFQCFSLWQWINSCYCRDALLKLSWKRTPVSPFSVQGHRQLCPSLSIILVTPSNPLPGQSHWGWGGWRADCAIFAILPYAILDTLSAAGKAPIVVELCARSNLPGGLLHCSYVPQVPEENHWKCLSFLRMERPTKSLFQENDT